MIESDSGTDFKGRQRSRDFGTNNPFSIAKQSLAP